MDASTSTEKAQAAHIVLFPYLAQGHISPFVSLATRLHQYRPDLTVTLVSTSRHITSIRSSLPCHSRLNYHSLPFYPEDHGLPVGTESMADLPATQITKFNEATKSLYAPFDVFISNLVSSAPDTAPLCIVSDFFFGWSVDIAHKHKAFHTTFQTMGAFGSAVFLSVWLNLPHTRTQHIQFSLPEYPEIVIDRSQLSKSCLESDGTDEVYLNTWRQVMFLHKTDAMVINTAEEFEPVGLGMLRTTFKFPIWPIGPLLAPADQLSYSKPEQETEITEFLDSQQPASVLYISFGSQTSIESTQMMQLAQGLEGSGCGFIWVVRPPIGSDPRGEFRDEWLPQGFKDRIRKKKRGLLVHGWAPQLKILSHKSTGAFLSHCGWNSILESMAHGVPIIAWPVGADQFFNSMMLVELGLAIEIASGLMDSSVPTKEKVEEMVGLVMGSNKKGMGIRRKAKEYGDAMSKAWDAEEGSSMKNLLEYVQSINA